MKDPGKSKFHSCSVLELLRSYTTYSVAVPSNPVVWAIHYQYHSGTVDIKSWTDQSILVIKQYFKLKLSCKMLQCVCLMVCVVVSCVTVKSLHLLCVKLIFT